MHQKITLDRGNIAAVNVIYRGLALAQLKVRELKIVQTSNHMAMFFEARVTGCASYGSKVQRLS